MKWLKHYRYPLICLIAGAMLPFAFAPFRLFWLAPLPPLALLICWNKHPRLKSVLWCGFGFGFGFFTVGTSWIYVSIHQYGGANAPLAILITLGFILLLTLGFILQGLLFYAVGRRGSSLKSLIVFPLSWVFGEGLRGTLFSGFPWLFLGYTQTPPSPLAGYAPLLGAYGLSFLITLCSALLYNVMYPTHRLSRYFSLLLFILIGIGGGALLPINWTTKIDRPLSVTLVQANIPQYVKWQSDQVLSTLIDYQQLTQTHWNQLILWPEGAIPLPADQLENYLNALDQAAMEHHATLISGIPTQDPHHRDHYLNSVMAFGNGHGHYSKQHLVPFGEYTPMHLQLLMRWFNFPMSDFVPGPSQQGLLVSNHTAIAPFICYEIAYSSLLLKALPQAEILINLSDDGWFGHSFAAAQQLQMAQIRALQSGRYLLAVTNSEITAIIGPKGRIIKQLKPFEPGVLMDTVYPMHGTTPWVRFAKFVVEAL